MIIIIDYDTGNTRNVQKALDYVGLANKISADPHEIKAADGLILPGVGAFSLAMTELKERGLVNVIKETAQKGTPILGVCLGMQLLLEGSMENGFTEGLGLIEGICEKLPDDPDLPVPHMGWNKLVVTEKTLLTKEVDEQYVYFVHSYYTDCEPDVIDALVQYSIKIPAMISKGNIYGTQFHPEKSSEAGLAILRGFKEVVEHARFTRN
ncbi:imidazole glycerol phosphate synthase, glutamine amidotransferase subunit [Enterococcus haemoperoxidus ATCC BAA-382]|uniref:Imidazole glycerol phosphate synthase subunit HisH n=1 Tax=Enterococcus haemoperoxidus ATCC BAA-382 TaxID=1158608 RepID=R2SYD7_9ENTE|nr:imidazole glycerol phosphate synthase subunit HisH [Enterococcus haemoperoxidus]EOH92984.1 imidazole glycerol phosphate synthase, glutamine amidotransferase subunit [Enterococcus haemoperoxidus ATCC BAA-382]EOT61438.1 imidazole glycerol phosphate synthase, glutamine amidotransferase subunit [Enterococcus haemoperoxidus ATCC BAA-382]OJG55270.1 imidazole glycerol phosphate synthase, glutamine amidotransferase subunit [Enterococcus haemoperoxidus]